MGQTLTDILLFGKAQSSDVNNGKFVIYRRNIMRWSALGGYLDIIVKGVSPLSLPDAIANSLSYVKAFGGTEQRNLPDGYIERQFIYMMGGSYLLTDIVPTYDCKIEMDFQTTSFTSYASFLGGRTQTNQGAGLNFGYVNNLWVVDAFTTGSRYISSVAPATNTRYKFIFDNQVATLTSGNSTLFTNTFTGTESNGLALAINGFNNNNSVVNNTNGIYLYSFKVWNGQGEMVMNLVPAVQKGTVPVVGFYDTVSGTFKTATAGTFAAGGEAVPTPDTPMDIVSNNGVLKASRNLFNVSANPLEQGGIASNNGQNTSLTYGQRVRTNDYVPVKPSTTYTASVKDLQIYYLEYAQDKTYTDIHSSGFADNSVTFTTGANTYFIRLQFRKSDNSDITPSEVTNVQLEQGSTVTPYTPYSPTGIYTDGTVETIGMIAGNLVDSDIAGANINSAGKIVSSSKIIHTAPVAPGETYTCDAVGTIAYFTEKPVMGSVSYDSSRITTSTPTFTVPNDPTIKYVAFSNDTATSYCVQGSVLYSGGTATAEMLLKVGDYQDEQEILSGAVTRNAKALVLDGVTDGKKMNPAWNSTYKRGNINLQDNAMTPVATADAYCTHFVYDASVNGNPTSSGFCTRETDHLVLFSFLGMSDINSVADANAWLADQYAAGTPVIVIYPLAEPTTESVAGQTLQVTDGDNVLEITQASLSGLELEAEYQAAVSLTIQEVQDANLDPNVEVTIN